MKVMKKLKNQKGFTMLELLIVITIMGAVATMAVPHLTERVQTSKAAEVKNAREVIQDACSAFNQDTGGFWPVELNDLIIDPILDGWAGPYLEVANATNPWGGSVELIEGAVSFYGTVGNVLYLDLTGVNIMAAKKLERLIDAGNYDFITGYCIVLDNGDGTADVQLFLHDTP